MKLKSLVLCAALFSTPGWSQVIYGVYTEVKDDPRAEAYISGLIHGVTLTNAQMKVVTGQALFCPPAGFTSDTKYAVKVIEAMAQHQQPDKRNDVSLMALLLKGLIEVFPCAPAAAPR